ncbi:VOC family protein [Rhizobium sp. L1K21]|uniref:VOC family protein n=1 Tax=Rhizobium sp. L1K21 TaxID=2954933 RepID=UPI002093F0FD|nr:VOC family protein [Rhizobium sp. L1K21]MCO6187933.1 VOC family protein [Rhizobium sp. L1K21]
MEGDGYSPSSDGPLVYLDATGKLDRLSAELQALGGEIILPRTYVSEEGGEIVLFRDTEGNRLGLHSPLQRPVTGPVSDQTMQGLLAGQKPGFAFVLTRGPRFEDPELANLQWEHARNMFNLMREGKLTHVSALPGGASILGFGLMLADSREEVAEILAEDPGVAAGRLAFEVMTAVSFDADKTRHKL